MFISRFEADNNLKRKNSAQKRMADILRFRLNWNGRAHTIDSASVETERRHPVGTDPATNVKKCLKEPPRWLSSIIYDSMKTACKIIKYVTTSQTHPLSCHCKLIKRLLQQKLHYVKAHETWTKSNQRTPRNRVGSVGWADCFGVLLGRFRSSRTRKCCQVYLTAGLETQRDSTDTAVSYRCQPATEGWLHPATVIGCCAFPRRTKFIGNDTRYMITLRSNFWLFS
jgi:hypothetical protein